MTATLFFGFFVVHWFRSTTSQRQTSGINARLTSGWILFGLEALPVYDGRSTLIVLELRDPHLLEGRQGRDDGATDPHRALPLWRRDDLDLHTRGRQGGQFLLHPVHET